MFPAGEHVRPGDGDEPGVGPGDSGRRGGGVQQARRRPARLRGCGIAGRKGLRQVPVDRDCRAGCQRPARPMVCRTRHHRRLRSTRDLPRTLPRRTRRQQPSAAVEETLSAFFFPFLVFTVVQTFFLSIYGRNCSQ